MQHLTESAINQLRKMAGLAPQTPAQVQNRARLNESAADDDEDPDAKIASEDKRQKDFEGKAAKAGMWDQLVKSGEKSAKAKEDGEKPAEKKEKPEAKDGAAARRGKAPNENSKNQRAVAWIKNNPSARRGDFIKWAAEHIQVTPAYASTLFAKHNPKSGRKPAEAAATNEAWLIEHPYAANNFLAEKFAGSRENRWVDIGDDASPHIFESVAAANEFVGRIGNQSFKLVKVDLSTLDADEE